jgi:hypothetical protein
MAAWELSSTSRVSKKPASYSVMPPLLSRLRANNLRVQLALGLALALAVALVISGQVPPRGLLVGTVQCHNSDASLLPYSGARVVFHQFGGAVYHVTADRKGDFSITLPSGSYQIKNEFVLGPDFATGRPSSVQEQDFRIGPREITVHAGDRIQLSLGFDRYYL